jgi:hypothetical protein
MKRENSHHTPPCLSRRMEIAMLRYRLTQQAACSQLRACLGISGMNGNEGHWGGGISIISQNFSKSPSILFHPLDSSISQTSPQYVSSPIRCNNARCKQQYQIIEWPAHLEYLSRMTYRSRMFFSFRCISACAADNIRAIEFDTI